jgi:hypothetical protein
MGTLFMGTLLCPVIAKVFPKELRRRAKVSEAS